MMVISLVLGVLLIPSSSIHDDVLSQRVVDEILKIGRKIVGHFKRASLACFRLKEIQSNLGLPVHHLLQDEPRDGIHHSIRYRE